MSNHNQEMIATIDDYLLSIASGLRKAQAEFDALASGPNASGVTYAVPKLDFELKMEVSVTNSKAVANRYLLRNRPLLPGAMHLVMKPLIPTSNSTVKSEMISTIKGSFVSVPSNGGRPPVIIGSDIKEVFTDQEKLVEVIVFMNTAAGEPVVNTPVEFNVDRDASLPLNNERELKAGTVFEKTVINTDEDGLAIGLLRIIETEPASIVVAIDTTNQTEIVNYKFKGSQ